MAYVPSLATFDATRHPELTEEAIAAFRRDGVLLVKGLVGAEELDGLRNDTVGLVDHALAKAAPPPDELDRPDGDDLWFRAHRASGRTVPFRQEYVIARSAACRRLLAHPFLVRSMQRLMGPNVTPTWDSMVFKSEGAGAIIPWHRDDEFAPSLRHAPICNVDVYLDASDERNGLWAIPGSQHWTAEQSDAEVARRNAGPFDTDGAVVLPMEPGDALLHDIGLLHGSPPAASWLRRVVYFEFRSAEDIIGRSHTAAYCTAKQRLWASLIAQRAGLDGVEPPTYAPTLPEPLGVIDPHWQPPTWRYRHDDFAVAR